MGSQDKLAARFYAARRAVIEKDLRNLNPMQRQAAMSTEGPLLILAGAGSGKTTTLIQRVYVILTYGRGSDEKTDFIPENLTEEDVSFLENFPDKPNRDEFFYMRDLCAVEPPKPWRILAITFTNKAAGELKDRLAARLGPEIAGDVWASTFHAACTRILRRFIDKIGFERDFTIYDADDSQRLMRDIIKDFNLDKNMYSPKAILREISDAKDHYINANDYLEWAGRNQPDNYFNLKLYAKLYSKYQEKLRAANALDFDDIIFHTVSLLEQDPEVREYYQNQFRYVLVDEYQDTNYLQYKLICLLTEKSGNLCVVGDDDQSIYAFRGADIRNILQFEKQFPNARKILLEQNYRSTPNILNAANAVICNNLNRGSDKKLWTENPSGDIVRVRTCQNEMDEADFIAGEIQKSVRNGLNYKDSAILYRINALSNILESAMRNRRIPYKIIGGLKFFDRAEIKDMLAYLQIINNTMDDLRLSRIMNNPPRGIGPATVEKLNFIAQREGASLYEIIQFADQFPELSKVAGKLNQFGKILYNLYKRREGNLLDLFDAVRSETGYEDMLRKKNDAESQGRLENIQELRSDISRFIEQNPENQSLFAYLNKISLYTTLDDLSDSEDYVTLMTVHSAKGLEFPVVYVAGMEKGIFPSYNADTEEEMEEERRLCYVAMTRAKRQLILCNSCRRMRGGYPVDTEPSQFLDEIPEDFIRWDGKKLFKSRNYFSGFSYGGFPIRVSSQSGQTNYKRENNAAQSGQENYKRVYNAAPSGQANDQRENNNKNNIKQDKILDLSVGDSVTHDLFGSGTVISVQPLAGDVMITVDFEKSGTKKLMLKYASALLRKNNN